MPLLRPQRAFGLDPAAVGTAISSLSLQTPVEAVMSRSNAMKSYRKKQMSVIWKFLGVSLKINI